MIKILLQVKSKFLSEALKFYLTKGFNQNYEIFSQTSQPLAYDIVLYDQTSLKEGKPEDFSLSKKILIDNGLMDREILFIFIYILLYITNSQVSLP